MFRAGNSPATGATPSVSFADSSLEEGAQEVYDAQGQLLEEHSFTEAGNGDREAYSLFYSYDSGGNLLSWGDKNQPFTLSYEDESWPDLLTAFNGDPISYDAIGNPTLWRDNTSFTWANGRRLASAANLRGLSVSYVYNADGLRTSKTVNGVEHKYIWQGDKLVSEACGGRELEFFYDESGKPYAMSHRSGPNAEAKLYYYVTNLQGDVLSLVDAEGFSAAEYWYNAWGLPMGSSGAMAEVNPLRYRGYYFDQETGLYYLKSRYYDPFVCRFVNADVYASTGRGFIGTNMFAYCINNPVSYLDPNGYLPRWLEWVVDKAKGLVRNFRNTLVEAREKRRNNTGTINFGLSGSLGALLGVSGSLSIGIDNDGNFGVLESGAFGATFPTASFGGFISLSNASDLGKLGGGSLTVGGSLGELIVGGVDLNIMKDAEKKSGYSYAGSAMLGVGVGTPIELHAEFSQTYLWYFNIYEVLISACDLIL